MTQRIPSPPLDGVRILNLARLGPGPHCAQILADMGADVIYVEEPGPGTGRRKNRMLSLPPGAPIRRNSRSIALDLKHLDGRAIFYRMLDSTDAVMEGFRPGVVERLRIDYSSLRERKASLVYASFSGYGQDGPYSAYVGHDINYQGLTGILGLTGAPNDHPRIPGNAIADNAGGIAGALAVVMGLFAKERTGLGQYIDLAMSDVLVTMMSLTIDQFIETGVPPRRGETMLTGAYPWYNVYETKDGKFLSVGAVEPWFYENLCRLLGREDLAGYQYCEGETREHVFASFREVFRTKTRDEWLALLMPADTCVAPVYSVDEVVADPHLRRRGTVLDVEQAGGRTRPEVGTFLKFPLTQGLVRRPGPGLGENTRELLEELGYESEAVTNLEEQGVVWDAGDALGRAAPGTDREGASGFRSD